MAEHPFQLNEWTEFFIREADPWEARDHFFLGKNLRSIQEKMDLVLSAWSEVVLLHEIASFAHLRGWKTFPEILERNPSQGAILEINQGLNLRLKPNQGIANSIELSHEKGGHLIVTGPNGLGKSTYLRMVAHLVLLAQLGAPVPAESMRLTPLQLLPYSHPSDDAAKNQSLFMEEARTIIQQVYQHAKKDPFSLVIMDEIMPGTIPEIREDAEIAFLLLLSSTGALSLTATHNWGTTALAHEKPDTFKNAHVSDYRIKPGAQNDLAQMYSQAATILREQGWPEFAVQEMERRGRSRIQNQQSQK